MKTILIVFLLGVMSVTAHGQVLPPLEISSDKQYLVTGEGEPFFWLGGTAWEMIHRLTREETDIYLADRASKGFTVIQTVILAELDGLNTPNAYGHLPLIDNDPARLNEEYFEHVDYVIGRAEELGLYIALLPAWGDKFNKRWGTGPEIFNPRNAETYGTLLAKRYLQHNNIVWILGGDRNPEKDSHYDIIRAMARGIRKVDSLHLISYHPSGGRTASDFFNEDWLDVDMFQSGHSRTAREYEYVEKSKGLIRARPVINGEARYENIPDRFWEDKSYGRLDDADVRVSAYWTMLAGAAGYTYGCNDIWQMYDDSREPVIDARTEWEQAINLPGSFQMGYMRKIFSVLPWQSMDHDQSLILNDNPEDESYIVSAIGADNDFILAYTPAGRPVEPDMTRLEADAVLACWFNPGSGSIRHIGEFSANESYKFKPGPSGRGNDFLLILVDRDLSSIFSVYEGR
ncbi:MAG: glycoside hydrolase family 140 protein [Bacteroidales bacterium]